MSRPRRILRTLLAVGTIGQIPGVLMAGALIAPLPALAGAALVSIPFFVRFSRGLRPDGVERGPLAYMLLGFYWWWGASMLAGCLFPLAWIVARLAGGTTHAAAAVALGIGLVGGFGGVTWNRIRAQLRRVDVRIAGLDPALDGYRIAQLSDLHMGGHTTPERVRGWVDRVNALGADLVAVTGDLITMGDAHIDRVAEELGRLRAADGVALCLGNHDYFGDTDRLVSGLEREGVEVLRNRGRVVESARGGRYYLAGVDDTWSRRADVAATMATHPRPLPAIVLAHDPHLFEACAKAGATLVLSGHTHGGQVALPLLSRTVNIARIAYRYTAGLYRKGDSWLYVSLGAGTTGPPLRIGAPSEITLLTLRAA